MRKLLLLFVGAAALAISASSVSAEALTDDQYAQMVDRLNNVSVDKSDPGKALEEVYQVDRDLSNMGALDGIKAGIEISGSPASVLRETMGKKLYEAMKYQMDVVEGSLKRNVPDGVAAADTKGLEKAYLDLAKVALRHIEDHRYSPIAGAMFNQFGNVVVNKIGEINAELVRRGSNPRPILIRAQEEIGLASKEECDSDVAKLGVSTKHLSDRVLQANSEGTMSSVFCTFTQAMSKNGKLNGKFERNSAGYEATLLENGSGGIMLTLSKNGRGEWLGHKISYLDNSGTVVRSQELSDVEWLAAIAGLKDYWRKFN